MLYFAMRYLLCMHSICILADTHNILSRILTVYQTLHLTYVCLTFRGNYPAWFFFSSRLERKRRDDKTTLYVDEYRPSFGIAQASVYGSILLILRCTVFHRVLMSEV